MYFYIKSDPHPSSLMMRRRKKTSPPRESSPSAQVAHVLCQSHQVFIAVQQVSGRDPEFSLPETNKQQCAESKWSITATIYACMNAWMHACTHSRRLLSVFNIWFRIIQNSTKHTNVLTLIPIVIDEYIHCQMARCCQPFHGFWPSRREYPTAHTQLNRNVAGWCGNLLSLELNSSILWHKVHAVWRDVQISISCTSESKSIPSTGNILIHLGPLKIFLMVATTQPTMHGCLGNPPRCKSQVTFSFWTQHTMPLLQVMSVRLAKTRPFLLAEHPHPSET